MPHPDVVPDRFPRTLSRPPLALLDRPIVERPVRSTPTPSTERVAAAHAPPAALPAFNGVRLDRLIQPGTLRLQQMLEIARQLAGALKAAHEVGLVHGDLRPHTVLVADPGQARPFARLFSPGMGGEDSGLEVSAAYLAPEQVSGHTIEPRTDVYALGAVLYEMLAGSPPFAPAEYWQLAGVIHREPPPPLFKRTPAGERIPEALELLVMACLSKSPGHRPASMAKVISELDRLSRATKVRRWWLAPASAAVVASLLGGAAISHFPRLSRGSNTDSRTSLAGAGLPPLAPLPPTVPEASEERAATSVSP